MIVAGAALIFGLTFFAYCRALTAGFIWDDDSYVTENAALDSLEGLRRVWFELGATDQYYPMTFTSFWIEQRLWGDAPLGYHLVNVLLHAGSAVLLWRLLRRLAVPGAWFAGVVFAVHPLFAESVAWVTERKNVLSGFLYLASFWTYLPLLRLSGTEAPGPSRPVIRYFAATALFAAALLSKTVTASLPVALAIVVWWKRGRVDRRKAVRLMPWLVMGLVAGLTTAVLERDVVGTRYVEWDLGAVDRVLIAGRALWFYLGKLVWPVELIFIYPKWAIDRSVVWQFGYPAACVGLIAVLIAIRRRIGRGPAAAMIFYGVTLFPALGFVDVYPMRFSYVADHFAYLAMLGPIALAAVVIERAVAGHALRVIVQIACIAALLLLTVRRTAVYEGPETLWRDTLAKNAGAWMAHGNLAAELGRQGHFDEAIEQYRRGLELKDDAPRVHFNLAGLLARTGRRTEAIREYETAVAQAPHLADAHNNLGVLLAEQGRVDEAAAHYRRAVSLAPSHADAWNNLGNLSLKSGRFEEAAGHYREAIRQRPAFALAWFNLGQALSRQNQTEGALDAYRQAAALDDGFAAAHTKLGVALARQGDIGAAIRHLRRAVELNPDHAEAARLLKAIEGP